MTGLEISVAVAVIAVLVGMCVKNESIKNIAFGAWIISCGYIACTAVEMIVKCWL